MQEQRWTLDELAERVDVALTVDYAGPPSARVRAVPDRRAIRWYTTIGLIDRPVAHRGRTALYGPRHLLQLVAVKRLQASGLPAGRHPAGAGRRHRHPAGTGRPPPRSPRRPRRRRVVAGPRLAPTEAAAPRRRCRTARGRCASGGLRSRAAGRVLAGAGGHLHRRPRRLDRLAGSRSAGRDPAGGAVGRGGDPAAGTGAAGGCGGRCSRPRRGPAAAGGAPGTGARPARPEPGPGTWPPAGGRR